MNTASYLSACRDELDKRCADVSYPHWQYDEWEDDIDGTYCEDCANKMGGNIRYAGYYPETDGVSTCDTCGNLLCYVLTKYGTKSEIDYFLNETDRGWDWDNADDCFVIAAILGSVIGDGYFDVTRIDRKLKRDLLRLLRSGKNTPKLTP